MSFFNPFAIGFVCVAAGFVVGVDYVVQSKAAGSNPGEYAFASYLDGYGIRVDDTIAFIDKTRRQSVEARTHLPMDPEGWERVEWDMGAIDMEAITAGMTVVGRMAAKNEWRKSLKLANYEAWEYRKGDEIVRISASYDEERERSVTAIAGQLTGTFHGIEGAQYRPYKAVANVPFLAVSDPKYPEAVTQIVLEARMGDEILIGVAADASPDSLLELLEQIDFSSLNLMLNDPLPYVGEGVPELTSAQELTLAGLQARALNSGQTVSPEMVAAVLSGETVEQAAAQTATQVERTQLEAKPKKLETSAGRIQLSGGRTCLSESSRLCN